MNEPRKGSLTRRRLNQDDDLLKSKKVLLYTRVSTDNQKLSPTAQLDEARTFAAAKNLTIDASFFEAQSAKKTKFRNRKSAKELLAHAKKHGIRTILIIRLDRAFRSLIDCVTTMDELSREGIRFRMIDNDIDPDTMAGKMLITIMAMMAEFQCDIRSSNQVAAFNVLRKQRIMRNNNPPYGWDPEDQPTASTKSGRPAYRLIPNPTEQEILAQIQDAHQQGTRISHIARRLNDNNIPTKKAGQIHRGKVVSGQWHPLTVQRVLEHAELATAEELANTSS